MSPDATSLPAIAHELDLLTSELRVLESRLRTHRSSAPHWETTHVVAQADALHVRVDALTDEVRGWQALVAAAVSRVGAPVALDAAG